MYVNLIDGIYEGASTKMRRLCGETMDFSVRLV